MMRNYLRRGYEFYLNADTAVVQRSITSDVNNMYALILALLQLLSDSVVSLFVISYCFISSGTMTILMAVVLLLLMWLIKRVLKPIMYKAGKDNQDYYSSLFKWISQTVQGIKEVKISGKEQYFVSEYRKCGKGYVDAVQRYSLYNQVPKLLIETACVATMVGYMIFLVATGVPTENMLTVFGTLAAAALVLLPCVNRINNQINSIAYFEPFFMGVSDNLQDEINGQNIDMSFATDEDEKLDVYKEQLNVVADSVKKDDEFRAVMAHPKISKEEKKGMLETIYGKQIDHMLLNFLKLLIDKGRFAKIEEIRREYNKAYNDFNNIQVVHVKSATPLQKEEIAKLKETLEKKLQKKVDFVLSTDKDLIAGIRIKINDQIIDNTALGRLQRLKRTVLNVSETQ